MRTIKFKAKRLDNGEWIAGNLFCPEAFIAGVYICPETNYADFFPNIEEVDDVQEAMKSGAALGRFIEVIPETVCQFTGLVDKHKVEIYEGDEVLFVGGTCSFLICGNYGEKHEIGKTLFVECLLSGYTLREERHLGNEISNLVGNVHNYDLWNHASSLKVTGNIHDK